MLQYAGATDRRRGERRQKRRVSRKSHKCRAGHIVFVLVTEGKGILALRNRNGKSHCGTIFFLVSRRGTPQLSRPATVINFGKKTCERVLIFSSARSLFRTKARRSHLEAVRQICIFFLEFTFFSIQLFFVVLLELTVGQGNDDVRCTPPHNNRRVHLAL